jgi:hypothetical protein
MVSVKDLVRAQVDEAAHALATGDLLGALNRVALGCWGAVHQKRACSTSWVRLTDTEKALGTGRLSQVFVGGLGRADVRRPVARERNPATPLVPGVQRRLLPHPADGGDRTHTLLPVLDFESSASANSATSAFCEEATTNPFATKRKRTSREDRPRLRRSFALPAPDSCLLDFSLPDLFHGPTSVLSY